MMELRATDGGVELSVRALPRASRNALAGLRGRQLKVAVTAAPSGGRANRALEEVLAEALGVRRSAVEVVAGHASRDKVVRVAGLSAAEAERRLASILPGEASPATDKQ